MSKYHVMAAYGIIAAVAIIWLRFHFGDPQTVWLFGLFGVTP